MNSELIEKWFIKKDYPESTRKLYSLGIRNYCNLIGKCPEELLNEAEHEEETIPRLRNRKIDYYLPKFKKHLEDSKLAPQTIKVYLSAIKSFYKAYQIEIPEISTKVSDICLEKNDGRLLTREDIQKMIEISPIREKAIIYLMALTGMSQAEMRSLTIKKFLYAVSEVLDKKIVTIEDLFEHEKELENVVLSLTITRKKVNYRYQTFIPPEVSRNIVYYLKERTYGRNEKIRITDINKEIFVSHTGEKLTKNNVSGTFNRIGKKLGFRSSESGAYGFWRSHGLRKYFISTIINQIGDHVLADYLVGHKISPIKRAYWKADPEKLKKKYMEALPYLSIDEIKVKDIENPEFKELKEKYERDSKVKDEEMDRMNKKMEIMDNMLKELLEKQLKN